MEDFRTQARKKLEGLDVAALQKRLEAVDSDIKNLEEELVQREELLKFIDGLILKRKNAFKLKH